MNHKCSDFCQEYGCFSTLSKGELSYLIPSEEVVTVRAGVNDREPVPKKNDSKPIWEMVIADMKERDLVGEKRYGTKLQAFNGRNSAVDAYQEGLDLAVYLRQLVEERKEMIEVLKWYDDDGRSDKAFNLLKKLGEL